MEAQYKIIQNKKTELFYAGFDSNKGVPVWNTLPDSALEVSEQDAAVIMRQLALLGFETEAK